jgi:tetratricopeptide (TPR) repeat protein
MIRSLSFLCLMLLLSLPSMASISDLWQQGNQYYQQKKYDSAIICFEQVRELRARDARVYYNLGNAYYRMNNIGMAVLNYQRALRIDPGYKEAADNLLVAEGRISNHIQKGQDLFFVRWWDAMTHPSKANGLAVAGLIFFLLLLGAILLRRYREQHWIRPQLIGGVVVLWCVFILLAFIAAGKGRLRDHAVVLTADAPMVHAPQQTQAQSYIPEGTTVKILGEKAGFAEIRLPDGRSGWMSKEYLEEI